MATRMQQRRGTATQWTDADPILASGEIGFETDTNQFKIGDGVNHWSDLSYFKNLEDLGGSLDDYVLLSTKGQANGVAELDNTGKIPSSQIPDLVGLDSEIASSVADAIAEEVSDRDAAIAAAISTEVSDRNSAISSAISTEVTNRNTAISNAVSDLESEISTSVADAVDNLVNGAPAALDTLNEIATVIGDSNNIVGSLITNIGGLNTSVANHSDATENVHGITNTAELATHTYVTGELNDATTTLNATIDNNYTTLQGEIVQAVSDHADLTANVHGITNFGDLATKGYADTAVSNHSNSTTNVHGIANFADLASQSYADDKADEARTAAEAAAATALEGHTDATTDVHGITDTANLVYTSDSRLSDERTPSAGSVTAAKIASDAVETAKIADNAVTNAKLADDAVDTAEIKDAAVTNAKLAGSIAQSKITNLETDLASKQDKVTGVSDTEIGYLDGVTSAIQTQLDAKAPLSAPTFTGTVNAANLTLSGNLTVNGTTTTVSSTNLEVTDPLIYIGTGNSANSKDLGIVGHFDNGTYQHTGLTRDASDGKWKLFSGVTTEPSDTIDFTTWTKDTLVVGPLEATTVTPSSGVVFTDGTQTKAGVPSITEFATAISSSATLASGQQDKFVPLTGAVTITLPATGYSTGQSIDFYQESGTGAAFASTNGVVGTPGLKFRTTNSVVTAMKTASGWLVFGDLSA